MNKIAAEAAEARPNMSVTIEVDAKLLEAAQSDLGFTSIERDTIAAAVYDALRALPRPVTNDAPPPWRSKIFDREGDEVGWYVGPDPTDDSRMFVVIRSDGQFADVVPLRDGYTWSPPS